MGRTGYRPEKWFLVEFCFLGGVCVLDDIIIKALGDRPLVKMLMSMGRALN